MRRALCLGLLVLFPIFSFGEPEFKELRGALHNLTRSDLTAILEKLRPDALPNAFLPEVCEKVGEYRRVLNQTTEQIATLFAKQTAAWADGEVRRGVAHALHALHEDQEELLIFCQRPPEEPRQTHREPNLLAKAGDYASLRMVLLRIVRSSFAVYRTLGEGAIADSNRSLFLLQKRWDLIGDQEAKALAEPQK